MSNRIQFVSHESFPEDMYIKEIVYICIDGRLRLAYIRKQTSAGALFWSPMTVGVTKDGRKEYFEAFSHDSSFLQQDIKAFLEARSWEGGAPISSEFQGMPF